MKKLIFILIIPFYFSNIYLSFAENKKLRWAADAEGNAPYIFQDPRIPTNNIGFEVDIIEAIAKIMKREPEFVQNQWDGLIPGLKRKDYDLAINGLEITEDRKQQVNFSDPYYLTYEQLVVLKTQDQINSLSDLLGKRAGALKNSLAERILKAKPGIQVFSYEGEVNAFQDMLNGRLDACLVDAPIAIYYTGTNPQYKLVGQPIGEISYGIAIRKEDKELLNDVNAALETLTKNGTLRKIYDEWKLWNYMMALYFEDKSETNTPPSKYEYFLSSHGNELSFSELMERYIGFLPKFAQGALLTLELSVVSMILAIIFGLFVALGRVYAHPIISKISVLFIEIIRGTPLLIQLYFIYFALPAIGIKFSPFWAAVIGLGLNYAAYEAENYRAGLFSVPKGQMEAAISLGMSKRQALRYVILPQALRLVIPPITNDFISLLKDSSLVSVITMFELTKAYNELSNTYFDYLGPGILVAIFYLLLGLPFVRLSKFAERKFSVDKRFADKRILT